MLSPQQIAQESLPRFARKGSFIGEVDYGKAGYDVYDYKRNKIYYKVDVRIDASEHPHKPTPIQLIRAMRNTIVSQRKPTTTDAPPPPPVVDIHTVTQPSSHPPFGGPILSPALLQSLRQLQQMKV